MSIDALVGDREIGAWTGEGVTIGAVSDALVRLRHGEQRMATRTSVVTLVIVATDSREAERACTATRRMRGRHPGRTITIVLGDTGENRIDADVALRATTAEGVDLWSEEIGLRVAGRVQDHLDSLIEPLTLPEVPVALWYVGRLPPSDDLLAAAADVVLVDTKEAGATTAFARVGEIERVHPVVDLSWLRLRPWRNMMAGLFDPPSLRPFVRGITHARVAGKESPRCSLAGWLSARLALAPDMFELVDEWHASISLEATSDGAAAVFAATRDETDRLLHGCVEIDGQVVHRDTVSLPDDSLPWSLGEALTHLGRDAGQTEALHAARVFPK